MTQFELVSARNISSLSSKAKLSGQYKRGLVSVMMAS